MWQKQTPAELEAHYGPDSAVQAASTWLDLVLRKQNFTAAWPRTHPDYRAELVGAWWDMNKDHPLLEARSREDVMEALTGDDPNDPLWPAFADTWGGAFSELWGHVPHERWAWASRPRPKGLDREVALLVKVDGETLIGGEILIEEPTVMEAIGLLMWYVAGTGWLMAGPDPDIHAGPGRP